MEDTPVISEDEPTTSCVYDLDELKSEFKEAQNTNVALKNTIEDGSAVLGYCYDELEKI